MTTMIGPSSDHNDGVLFDLTVAPRSCPMTLLAYAMPAGGLTNSLKTTTHISSILFVQDIRHIQWEKTEASQSNDGGRRQWSIRSILPHFSAQVLAHGQDGGMCLASLPRSIT